MKPQKARGNQRQSEAIRGNQAAPQVQSGAIRGNQMQSEAIGPHLRCNQVQSGAIRGNRAAPQVQSGAIRGNQMQSALCFRVFVFWADRKGLCFVFSCFGLAQRACVLCFRVLADPPQNTARGQDCLNQLLADGRTQQETLVKLKSDLEAVATLGYIELGAAAAATAADLKDMWDAYHGKGMGSIQRMLFLFLPAVMDVLLAALDFFIFTASAQADSEAVRESIVNRSSVWCVTITDECVTIAENEATRLGIDRPVDNRHTGLWIAFASAVPAISILYVMYIFASERARETNPSYNGPRRSRRTLELEIAQLRADISRMQINRSARVMPN